jgi:hypothetical protein
VDDVHVIPNYSYQVNGFCGKGFICTGDAHRFTDPIFSFGLTITMREGQFMAPIIPVYLEGANRENPNPFARSPSILRDGHRRPGRCPGFFLGASFILGALRRLPIHRVYNSHVCRSNLCARKLVNREGEREQSYKSSDLIL